ncbi:hypothetical protein RNJ44_04224 [Nakaseomyces bracarensis]|uniref:Uncharacterized protein n=1 Tax=Nakaseomyces bracarensis TaxID=273131 RepID=A0ABR4NUE3_9SACH
MTTEYIKKHAASTDFINMETPPRPKESPYLSYMDEGLQRPFPMRRRSTNYINTLRDKGLLDETSMSPPVLGADDTQGGNDVPSMDLQDNKHESTKYYMNGNPQMPLQFDRTVNMGDSIDYGKNSYKLSSKADEDIDPMCTEGRKRLERRESFEYEDFKKDIYDKLHIFRNK